MSALDIISQRLHSALINGKHEAAQYLRECLEAVREDQERSAVGRYFFITYCFGDDREFVSLVQAEDVARKIEQERDLLKILQSKTE